MTSTPSTTAASTALSAGTMISRGPAPVPCRAACRRSSDASIALPR